MSSSSRTTLTDVQYDRAVVAATKHLSGGNVLRNRDLRRVTGLNYDQAIAFFKRATMEGRLSRRGRGAATNYVLAQQSS